MSGLDGNVRSPRATSKEKSISHSLLSNIYEVWCVCTILSIILSPFPLFFNIIPPQFSYRKYKQKQDLWKVEELQKMNDD